MRKGIVLLCSHLIPKSGYSGKLRRRPTHPDLELVLDFIVRERIRRLR
mgnify:CR=1 FL=1